MPSTVFISYSRVDIERARAIHDGLEAERFTVWWDQENIRGDDYTRRLTQWIRASQDVVVLLSRRSVGSIWVKREVLLSDSYKRRIIPVYFDSKQALLDAEENAVLILLIDLDRISAYDGRNPLPELIQALGQSPFRQSQMAEPANNVSVQQSDAQSSKEASKPAEAPMKRQQAPRLSERVRRILMTGKGQSEPLLPPAPTAGRARLTFVLDGNLEDFPPELQTAFIDTLTLLVDVAPDDVRLISVRAGSIKITIELPESSARWLLQLQDIQAAMLPFLGAKTIEDLVLVGQTTDKDSLLTRLTAWLRNLSMPQRLVWAGGLAMLLLALMMVPLMRPPTTQLAFCQDLTLSAGRCPQGAPMPLFEGALPGGVLSDAPANVPILIAPRDGKLLSPQLQIRWLPVAAPADYVLRLQQQGKTLWETTLSNSSSLSYPIAGAPTLDRGKSYTFRIKTKDGREENVSSLDFQILSETEAQAIQTQEQTLRTQGLDETTSNVLVANLYANNELYSEALQLLEPIATTSSQPGVALLRGNIYRKLDLLELALQSYEHALKQAQASGDQRIVQHTQQQIDAIRARLGQ